jgi:hypothetical protein
VKPATSEGAATSVAVLLPREPVRPSPNRRAHSLARRLGHAAEAEVENEAVSGSCFTEEQLDEGCGDTSPWAGKESKLEEAR